MSTKRLILNATNKGGCGKSTFTVNLVQYLREHPWHPRFAAFDPDHANLTLRAFHPDVHFMDVDDPESMDRAVEVLEECDISVVDGLGSQQRRTFQKWIDETNLFSVTDAFDARITYVLMIEEDSETIEQAGEMMQLAGDSVDWLIVLNQRFNRRFSTWELSAQRELALSLGAREMILPKIPELLMTYMGNTKQTLSAAAGNPEVKILDRQRFKNLQRAIYASFDSVVDYIFPESAFDDVDPVDPSYSPEDAAPDVAKEAE